MKPFVFGASTFVDHIHNQCLLHPKYRTQSTLFITFVDSFLRLHEHMHNTNTTRFLCILRKPFRRAIRPSDAQLKPDEVGDSCTICFQRKACILCRPCNHMGMCNSCAYRTFQVPFRRTSSRNEVVLSKRMNCPFCKTTLSSLLYVFHTH